MGKNIIWAIVLSALVLIIYNLFAFTRAPSPPKEIVPSVSPKEKAQAPLETKKEREEFILENNQIRVTCSSEGGEIKSWFTKHSKKELVREDIPCLGLKLFLPEEEAIDLNKEKFNAKFDQEKKEIVFLWEDKAKGYKVVKTLNLSTQGYYGLVTIYTEGLPIGSYYELSWQGGIERKWGDEEQLAFYKGVLFEEEKQGISPSYGRGISWLGIRQKRDLLVILASLNHPREGIFGPNFFGFKDSKIKSKWMIYAGPQNYSELRLVNMEIEKAIGEDYQLTRAANLSFWGNLSVGLIKLLIFFYSFTHSYGLAIVLLTILIYGILFPLTYKQLKSMRKMSVVQPEIASIQKKFKDDPQKLQMETMKVYKKYGVNPLSGCLPMLIQFPIIIFLYRAILGFNFSDNPSFLWIKDLGKYDIPLLLMVGGVMMAQSLLSRKSQPKTDQGGLGKLMAFFPILIIIFLWQLPSAVMIYWFTSTLISLFQQILINRKMTPASVKPTGKRKK